MRIAFILLAHERAGIVLRLVEVLLDADPDCHVVAHYDRRSPKAEFRKLEEARQRLARFHLVADRAVCAWGEFGLVDGVVKAMRHIRDHDVPCDREMLISASCWPIRPLAQLKRYLAERPDVEFITCNDEQWMTAGLREERYLYWYWLNFKCHKVLFDANVVFQRKLGIKRRFPPGLVARFGPQWWCLTRATCESILTYIEEYPKAYAFFRKVWIPDECCIQTLVHRLVPDSLISGYPLTYYQFSKHGKPVVFHDDHKDFLQDLNFFFARKISNEATQLHSALAKRAAAADRNEPLAKIGTPSEAYADEMRDRVATSRPGQMFWADQIAGTWPGAFGKCRRHAVVLYGPGAIVRQASATLRKLPALEVLGRVFRPERVGFGKGRSHFRGLRNDDVAIRDADPALYLSRIIERSRALPVIELSPVDDPRATWTLLESENIIFVALVPNIEPDNETERLFLALAIAEASQLGGQRSLSPRLAAAEKHLTVRYEIDGFIHRAMRESDRYGVSHRILQGEVLERLLRLHFGAFAAPNPALTFSAEEERLLRSTGGAASALLDATPRLRAELARLSPDEALASLPAHWRDYFMAALAPVKKPSTRPAHRRPPPLETSRREN
jgi:hypothetical protein